MTFGSRLPAGDLVAVGGAALGQVTDVVDGRTVGVLTLWTVAAAQLWLGAVLWRKP